MDEPLKYIIVDERGCELAIVFNSIIDHDQVANRMNVISAGFCRLPNELNSNVSAWGESKTLKKKSREEDAKIILHDFRKDK